MKKSVKKPSLFKRFIAHLPKKGQKMPRNLKISVIVAAAQQLALTGIGAYLGVASAATVPGMVGLGIAGFVMGNVLGGLVGLTVFAAVIGHNLSKAAKSKRAAKQAPKAPAPEAQKPAAPVTDKQLKNSFDAANENQPTVEKPAAAPPVQKASGPKAA